MRWGYNTLFGFSGQVDVQSLPLDYNRMGLARYMILINKVETIVTVETTVTVETIVTMVIPVTVETIVTMVIPVTTVTTITITQGV